MDNCKLQFVKHIQNKTYMYFYIRNYIKMSNEKQRNKQKYRNLFKTTLKNISWGFENLHRAAAGQINVAINSTQEYIEM